MRLVTIFYGDISYRGFVISSLLYERNINHNFINIDGEFILYFLQKREVIGFEAIKDYLEHYKYVFDLF